jgi:hypothetical protein
MFFYDHFLLLHCPKKPKKKNKTSNMECPVCLIDFQSDDRLAHLPRSWPCPAHHAVCSQCITDLMAIPDWRCPFCRVLCQPFTVLPSPNFALVAWIKWVRYRRVVYVLVALFMVAAIILVAIASAQGEETGLKKGREEGKKEGKRLAAVVGVVVGTVTFGVCWVFPPIGPVIGAKAPMLVPAITTVITSALSSILASY